MDGRPARLDHIVRLSIPIVRVRYRFEQRTGPSIFTLVEKAIATRLFKE